jgi:NitT/TauT family transport system permease protein
MTEIVRSDWNEFLPQAGVQRRRLGLPDFFVGLGVLALLVFIAHVGANSIVEFNPPHVAPSVDLDPRRLPHYAARSSMRMLIALVASVIFSLVYGYAAARSRRAERILVPLLDILQSVPVLGFLAVTVEGFIALFPGSLLGLEAASIFAIFTSQVWNITFSYFQTLRAIPNELNEMANSYRLPGWQRFTRPELPASMIGRVWNGMMSFGGG